jgi:hypothetical protein
MLLTTAGYLLPSSILSIALKSSGPDRSHFPPEVVISGTLAESYLLEMLLTFSHLVS